MTPAPLPPEVLTSEEAAELLKVNVATLHRMPVPFATIGTTLKRPRRRYLRSSVLAWLKAQETPEYERAWSPRRTA